MAVNFGWSYPPGVTGREYAIAGPDWEEELGACPACGEYALFAQGFRDDVLVFCTDCDFQQEDAPVEPDWDAICKSREENPDG